MEKLTGAPTHRDSFEEIYERHWTLIRQVNKRRGFSEQATEDIAQNTFLKAWLCDEFSPKGDDPARALRNWLMRIAQNGGIDAIRQERKAWERIEREREKLLGELVVFENPLEEMLREETRGILERAISKLSPRQAEMVILYHFQELEIREAAERLGIAEGTAKVHLWRARKKLRELLTDPKKRQKLRN